jgi:membrane-associated PAP2 superfamily phosphatase
MTSNHKTPPWGRRLLLSPNFLIPIFIMGLSALAFNIFAWDNRVQSFYYRDAWFMNERTWVQAIYRFGNIPALLVTILALIAYLRSWAKDSKVFRYRHLSAYLVLAMLIGPGLIVNSILKDHWGRPRPRDVVEYGGRYAYEAPLTIDSESPGKSFPCGHATMGFYFFAPAFILGLKRNVFGKLLFYFALFYGTLIGWVRVMQGGHFVSDVIFAGAIVYLCTYLLWKLMKLDTSPYLLRQHQHRTLKLWQKALIIVVGILIILGVTLATPYQQKQVFTQASENAEHLVLRFTDATVSLAFADSGFVQNTVHGFGFPGSRARLQRHAYQDSLLIRQNIKGFFTELGVELKCVIDTTQTKSLLLHLERGEVFVKTDSTGYRSLDIQTHNDRPEKPTARYHIVAPNVVLQYSE